MQTLETTTITGIVSPTKGPPAGQNRRSATSRTLDPERFWKAEVAARKLVTMLESYIDRIVIRDDRDEIWVFYNEVAPIEEDGGPPQLWCDMLNARFNMYWSHNWHKVHCPAGWYKTDVSLKFIHISWEKRTERKFQRVLTMDEAYQPSPTFMREWQEKTDAMLLRLYGSTKLADLISDPYRPAELADKLVVDDFDQFLHDIRYVGRNRLVCRPTPQYAVQVKNGWVVTQAMKDAFAERVRADPTIVTRRYATIPWAGDDDDDPRPTDDEIRAWALCAFMDPPCLEFFEPVNEEWRDGMPPFVWAQSAANRPKWAETAQPGIETTREITDEEWGSVGIFPALNVHPLSSPEATDMWAQFRHQRDMPMAREIPTVEKVGIQEEADYEIEKRGGQTMIEAALARFAALSLEDQLNDVNRMSLGWMYPNVYAKAAVGGLKHETAAMINSCNVGAYANKRPKMYADDRVRRLHVMLYHEAWRQKLAHVRDGIPIAEQWWIGYYARVMYTILLRATENPDRSPVFWVHIPHRWILEEIAMNMLLSPGCARFRTCTHPRRFPIILNRMPAEDTDAMSWEAKTTLAHWRRGVCPPGYHFGSCYESDFDYQETQMPRDIRYTLAAFAWDCHAGTLIEEMDADAETMPDCEYSTAVTRANRFVHATTASDLNYLETRIHYYSKFDEAGQPVPWRTWDRLEAEKAALDTQDEKDEVYTHAAVSSIVGERPDTRPDRAFLTLKNSAGRYVGITTNTPAARAAVKNRVFFVRDDAIYAARQSRKKPETAALALIYGPHAVLKELYVPFDLRAPNVIVAHIDLAPGDAVRAQTLLLAAGARPENVIAAFRPSGDAWDANAGYAALEAGMQRLSLETHTRDRPLAHLLAVVGGPPVAVSQRVLAAIKKMKLTWHWNEKDKVAMQYEDKKISIHGAPGGAVTNTLEALVYRTTHEVGEPAKDAIYVLRNGNPLDYTDANVRRVRRKDAPMRIAKKSEFHNVDYESGHYVALKPRLPGDTGRKREVFARVESEDKAAFLADMMQLHMIDQLDEEAGRTINASMKWIYRLYVGANLKSGRRESKCAGARETIRTRIRPNSRPGYAGDVVLESEVRTLQNLHLLDADARVVAQAIAAPPPAALVRLDSGVPLETREHFSKRGYALYDLTGAESRIAVMFVDAQMLAYEAFAGSQREMLAAVRETGKHAAVAASEYEGVAAAGAAAGASSEIPTFVRTQEDFESVEWDAWCRRVRVAVTRMHMGPRAADGAKSGKKGNMAAEARGSMREEREGVVRAIREIPPQPLAAQRWLRDASETQRDAYTTSYETAHFATFPQGAADGATAYEAAVTEWASAHTALLRDDGAMAVDESGSGSESDEAARAVVDATHAASVDAQDAFAEAAARGMIE